MKNYAQIILESIDTHEEKQAWSEKHGAKAFAQLVKDAETQDDGPPRRSAMTASEKIAYVREHGVGAFAELPR